MIVETPSLPISKRRAAPARTPVRDWWIEVIESRSALEAHETQWDRLAKDAIEPNVFLEPWLFLPQVHAFNQDRSLCAVLIYRHDPRPKQPPQLCGFFPLERRRRFKGLPIRTLRLWEQEYAYLNAPLLHREWARETLHRFFDWVAGEERCAFLDFPTIPAEGPFAHALLDVLHERKMLSLATETYGRAFLSRANDAETYCTAAMNPASRKEWRRQRKRLGELGRLESRVLQSDGNAACWIEQFLYLEASGWKGRTDTALARTDAACKYFRTIANGAFARGQLQMLGLFLDKQPIAMKCNFLSGEGGFAFKIAFDESYAKHSPGVQLELDNIAEFHCRTDLRWMDSCAAPGHFMINRLWRERRSIQRLLIATSRFTGNAVVGLLPLARALKRMVRR